MISLITRTYNRAPVLGRAIVSVLRQDDSDWELVIVDDGSTDNTSAVLARYADPRVRIFKQSVNRGRMAAGNTGLDQMRGDWFTLLYSDDELTPDALTEFRKVMRMDPSITAITCNCRDAVSGEFTGAGLDRDQYVNLDDQFRIFSGEHWGLTKTALIGNFRFNEQIPSESILWFKVNLQARRYYLHKGLRIYHREGRDRVSRPTYDGALARRVVAARAFQSEHEHLAILKKYRRNDYGQVMFNVALTSILDQRTDDARWAYREMQGHTNRARALLIRSGLIFGSVWMRLAYQIAFALRRDW